MKSILEGALPPVLPATEKEPRETGCLAGFDGGYVKVDMKSKINSEMDLSLLFLVKTHFGQGARLLFNFFAVCSATNYYCIISLSVSKSREFLVFPNSKPKKKKSD